MTIEKQVTIWNDRMKATHDNFKNIDETLTKLGFVKTKSFYDSVNGSVQVNDGGIWEKDNVKIETNYIIRYADYTPLSFDVVLIKNTKYKVLVNKFAPTGEINILEFIHKNHPNNWKISEVKWTCVQENSNIILDF